MEFYQNSNVAWLGLLVFHVVLAASLWKMAARTKTEPQWFALVPLLNFVLLLKIAGRPVWWLVLMLIPIVNIVTIVVATMALCERFGVNKWWGLASVFSPFNLVLYLYLAYGTEKAPVAPVNPPAPLA